MFGLKFWYIFWTCEQVIGIVVTLLMDPQSRFNCCRTSDIEAHILLRSFTMKSKGALPVRETLPKLES